MTLKNLRKQKPDKAGIWDLFLWEDLSGFHPELGQKGQNIEEEEVKGARWHLYLLGNIRIQKGKRKNREKEMGVPEWSENGWWQQWSGSWRVDVVVQWWRQWDLKQ